MPKWTDSLKAAIGNAVLTIFVKVGAEKLKQEGFNYDPCGHCTKGQKMGATIYITAEGACYHYRLDCSGLKRTIYMIPKKQVGNKKPCSRCGGK